MNEQLPLPQVKFEGTYAVHSMFHTIQGEGPFSGEPALFIRLEGCNLKCDFCDTDYTGGDRAQTLTAEGISDEAIELIGTDPTSLIVITGGEPFRQDLEPLVQQLIACGYFVQIETNGTMAPSAKFKDMFEDHATLAIVVSPKAHYVNEWIADQAHCFKYVLSHDSIDPEDGLPIMVLGRKSKRVARPPEHIDDIYVSPADMGDDTIASDLNVRAMIDSAMTHGYRLQLQVHKILGVE
jgi:organic radical activating enzyme